MALAVTGEGYAAAFLRCGLALTAAPTREEIELAVSEDWMRDSQTSGTMSYERTRRARR